MVLTFTIKPTIYGSMACRFLHCPCISNITGLGTGVKKTHLLTWLIKQMYKIALAKNKCIFFQNDDNLDFFIKNKGYLYLFKDKLRYGWQKKEPRSIYSYEQYWRRTC